MSTGFDHGGVISVPQRDDNGPAIQPCPSCGQALPNHLSVCALLPSSAIGEQTLEQVNEEEHKLGEAV